MRIMLADLEKKISSNSTPEQLVGSLADRTPEAQSYPNVHHMTVLNSELHRDFDLSTVHGRVALAGGIPVQLGDKKGMVFQRSKEKEQSSIPRDPEEERRIIEEVNQSSRTADLPRHDEYNTENLNYVNIQRSVSPRKGKWLRFSEEQIRRIREKEDASRTRLYSKLENHPSSSDYRTHHPMLCVAGGFRVRPNLQAN